MKVSEVFNTIQGEGPNVGLPTTFVRFGGCNLRCPGWPCDTLYAVLPEYRPNWGTYDPNQLAAYVASFGLRHVCITGGEPLIQSIREMEEFAELLWSGGYTVDLFTNGSRPLPGWSHDSSVTVVMDYKLPGSGEYGSFLETNWSLLSGHSAVKFVCKDMNDFDTAIKDVFENPDLDLRFLQFYFGVAYGHLKEAELGKWIEATPVLVQNRVRLNIQTHKVIGVR